MSVDPMWARKLEDRLGTIQAAGRGGRELARSVEIEVEGIRGNRDLTSEGKAIEERKARQEAERKALGFREQAGKAYASAVEIIRQARAARVIDPAAEARVRGLIASGMGFADIAETAHRERDDETLAALRAHVPYSRTDEGHRLNPSQLAEAQAGIEQMLGEIGRGYERDAMRVATEIREEFPVADEAIKFAILAAAQDLTPQQKMSLGFQTSESQAGAR